MVLGFAILEKPNVRELINRIAYQSKSIEFWESGVHHLVHIPATETTDKEISANRIDLNQIYLSYTPRSQIKNTLTAFFHRDWSGYEDAETALRAVVDDSDSTSITDYGTLQGEPESWPYITTSAHADIVIAWRLLDQKDKRILVEFSGGYYLSDLERGDIIEFIEGGAVDYITRVYNLLTQASEFIVTQDGDNILWHDVDAEETDTYLQDALLGLVTLDSDQFRILDMVRRNDASIQIQAISI